MVFEPDKTILHILLFYNQIVIQSASFSDSKYTSYTPFNET
jgi:hypothetical protein